MWPPSPSTRHRQGARLGRARPSPVQILRPYHAPLGPFPSGNACFRDMAAASDRRRCGCVERVADAQRPVVGPAAPGLVGVHHGRQHQRHIADTLRYAPGLLDGRSRRFAPADFCDRFRLACAGRKTVRPPTSTRNLRGLRDALKPGRPTPGSLESTCAGPSRPRKGAKSRRCEPPADALGHSQPAPGAMARSIAKRRCSGRRPRCLWPSL